MEPKARTDIHVRPLPDGSTLLFDPVKRTAYPVTQSAAIVWNACDGAHSPAAITSLLAEVYDAPAETIAGDVAAVLEHFARLGLLEA